MTTTQAAFAIAVAAGALVVSGVSLLAGLAWALIASGLLLFVSLAVLLYDPSPAPRRGTGRREGT